MKYKISIIDNDNNIIAEVFRSDDCISSTIAELCHYRWQYHIDNNVSSIRIMKG